MERCQWSIMCHSWSAVFSHFLFQVVSGIKYFITANMARTPCRKREAQELCEIPEQAQVMTVWRDHIPRNQNRMTGTSWGRWCIQMIMWSDQLNMLKPIRSFYWPFPVHLNVKLCSLFWPSDTSARSPCGADHGWTKSNCWRRSVLLQITSNQHGNFLVDEPQQY